MAPQLAGRRSELSHPDRFTGDVIGAAGAAHRFASRLGYALRHGEAEGVDSAFLSPVRDVLQLVGTALRPSAARHASRARPDVQQLMAMLASLAGVSKIDSGVTAAAAPGHQIVTDPLFENDPWAMPSASSPALVWSS